MSEFSFSSARLQDLKLSTAIRYHNILWSPGKCWIGWICPGFCGNVYTIYKSAQKMTLWGYNSLYFSKGCIY